MTTTTRPTTAAVSPSPDRPLTLTPAERALIVASLKELRAEVTSLVDRVDALAVKAAAKAEAAGVTP